MKVLQCIHTFFLSREEKLLCHIRIHTIYAIKKKPYTSTKRHILPHINIFYIDNIDEKNLKMMYTVYIHTYIRQT